jgi:hypothetical protein
MKDDTCLIACGTLKQELNLIMEKRNRKYPVVWIDSGKHASPDKLRTSVQNAIDGIPRSCKTILLLFGFCGNAMVGIESGDHTLVLPRAADCIPLFTGSLTQREKSSYFFTEGYINSGGSVATDTSKVFERYGEKRGLFILKKMLGHYKNFSIIDTGAYNVEEARGTVDAFAKLVEIPVSVIPGSLGYIDALLAGGWQEDSFLLVPPGKSISFEDSLSAGKAQGLE